MCMYLCECWQIVAVAVGAANAAADVDGSMWNLYLCLISVKFEKEKKQKKEDLFSFF